jgi:hypothetical protein
VSSGQVILIGSADLEFSDQMTISIVTVIFSAVISVIVARITTKQTLKHDHERALQDGMIQLKQWVMEYPFVEDDAFCKSWPATNGAPDQNTRYEVYCCHVFNLLRRSFTLSKGNAAKAQQLLHPDELVSQHYRWWQNDPLNQKAFPVEFRQYIAAEIRRLTPEP